MRVGISGVGVIGGFGCGISAMKNILELGVCEPENVSFDTGSGKVTRPVFRAETSGISSYFKPKLLRRVDHFSRMALFCACLALDDADTKVDYESMGVIVASGLGAMQSTYAFKDSINNNGDAGSSPIKFSNSVHNAAAAHLSIRLKIGGPNLTISQFDMSMASAILTACIWLEEKRVDSVLVGGVDEYCDVHGYIRHRLFEADSNKLSSNSLSKIKPFEFDNYTAIPGEGAVFFILTRDNEIKPDYGYITEVRYPFNYNKNNLYYPDNNLVIIGSDGHLMDKEMYFNAVPDDSEVTAYTPVYGSLPIGQGFDVAVAALSIRENRIFALPELSPERPEDYKKMNIVYESKPLTQKNICCLKLNNEGESALITLTG